MDFDQALIKFSSAWLVRPFLELGGAPLEESYPAGRVPSFPTQQVLFLRQVDTALVTAPTLDILY